MRIKPTECPTTTTQISYVNDEYFPQQDFANSCPKPFDKIYCFNGGKCYAGFQETLNDFLPFCKCAPNYHGRRCEYLFDSEIYGFSVEKHHIEMATLSTFMTFLIFGIIGIIICALVCKRYDKENESGSFPTMYATAVGMTSLSDQQVTILILLLTEVRSPVAIVTQADTFLVGYFDARIEHFRRIEQKTFKLRYLYNLHYFNETNGILLFYPGGLSNIESSASKMGLVWDMAEQLGAAVVFAEHRYFGESLPFGDYSFKSLSTLKYLTTKHALADYALLIKEFIAIHLHTPEEVKVLTFGAEYSGMLAAWLRLRLPRIVHGAWVSTSPVLYFYGGNVDLGAYDRHISNAFKTTPGCGSDNGAQLAKALNLVEQYVLNDAGRYQLNQLFRFDNRSQIDSREDLATLKGFIYEAFVRIVSDNLPSPGNIVNPMPANPLKSFCSAFSGSRHDSDEKLLSRLAAAVSIYYGENENNCLRKGYCDERNMSQNHEKIAQIYMQCTEIAHLKCTLGSENDFFWPSCTAKTAIKEFKERCRQVLIRYGFGPHLIDLSYVKKTFGFDYTARNLKIVFSLPTGAPWTTGSVQQIHASVKESKALVIKIPDAASASDMYQPNSCDLPSVRYARFQIINVLKCFVGDWDSCDTRLFKTPKNYESNSFNGSAEFQTCPSTHHGFPWNQHVPQNMMENESDKSSFAVPIYYNVTLASLAFIIVTLLRYFSEAY
ncbi:serine carboxypeptidase s28 domain-containing protein [Ditylenchus destructor]|uniref:Serine carboxypeptidase s28 domain-containing protein n=1 Tax=Ditylenchus destructor TaxID=166010 RepID=A0AAD4NJG7_9BILA|nr:serine carboxypeptidase s28 domain-containing protein [Ditylenchus destructor]